MSIFSLVWYALDTFWSLITFQPITRSVGVNTAFSMALIVAMCLTVICWFWPKWWNILTVFTIELGAILAAIIVTGDESLTNGWSLWHCLRLTAAFAFAAYITFVVIITRVCRPTNKIKITEISPAEEAHAREEAEDL